MNAFSIPGAPAWFNLLMNLSFQAALLAAIVWVVIKVFGRWIPPNWRALMWSLVILRSLIPFAPPSSFSVQNLFAKPTPLAPVKVIVEQPTPVVQFVQPVASNVLHIPLSHTLPFQQPKAETPQQPSVQPLAIAWGIGAIFFGGLLLARTLIIRRALVRTGVEPTSAILSILASCREAFGTRYPLRVTASDRIASPALTGFIPARLIIPTTFTTERYSPAQIRHILLHELAHVQQGHLLLHWLALMGRVVHWFNPAIHIAAAQMRQECELAADTAALKDSTAEERAAYGETILQVLSQSAAPPTLLALGMAEQARHLQQRLRALTSPPKQTFHLLGVALIAMIAATGLTGATQRESVSPITTGNLQGQADQQFIRNKNALSSGRLATLRNEQLRDSPLMEDARRLIEIGRLEEAKTLLKRALEEHPENHAALYYLNLIQEQHSGSTFRSVVGSERFNLDIPDKFVITQTLELPESNQPRQGTSSDSAIIVTITKTEPYFFLNEKPVTFVHLQEELAARTKKNPKVPISIRPDTDAPVSQVVRVIDAAKAANIKDVNILTKSVTDTEKSWNAPAGRELLPPNPLARTNVSQTSPNRQRLYRKLEALRIDDFPLTRETALVDLLKELGSEIRKRDPGGRGVNFIISLARDLTADVPPIDVEQFKIKFDPPIRDLTLGQFLDTIVKVAKPPEGAPVGTILRYSVEDYAIVFAADTAPIDKLASRLFRVDPNTFQQSLVKLLREIGSKPTPTLREQVRAFFSAAGVNFAATNIVSGDADPIDVGKKAPPGKAIFYNDRTGALFVRATEAELDIIENALHALNTAPPQVRIAVRIFELPSEQAARIQTNFVADRRITATNEFLAASTNIIPKPVSPLLAPTKQLVASVKDVLIATNITPASQHVIPRSAVQSLIQRLQSAEGVDALTMLNVITVVGRHVRISLEETRTIMTPGLLNVGGAQIPFGWTIDCIPDSFDGAGLQLTTIAAQTKFLDYDRASAAPLPRFHVRATRSPVKLPPGSSQAFLIPSPNPGPVPVFGGDVPVLGPLFQRYVLILVTPTVIDSTGNPVFPQSE